MTVIPALTVAVLFATGAYLILQRTLTRIILGVGLIGNGANLLLLVSAGPAGKTPRPRNLCRSCRSLKRRGWTTRTQWQMLTSRTVPSGSRSAAGICTRT